MTRVIALVVLALVLAFGLRTVASGPNTSAPASSQDQSAQLLDEVRRLREAIESLASTGARVQIVFGRLQIQEQRTATAARRLDDLRGATSRLANEIAKISGGMKDLEDLAGSAKMTEQQRDGIEAEMKQTKRVLERLEADRQRLQADEVDAAADLAAEQARWADLSRQLEELERALTPRRQ